LSNEIWAASGHRILKRIHKTIPLYSTELYFMFSVLGVFRSHDFWTEMS